MRLKSLYTCAPATNQRIRQTCVANIFIWCLLGTEVWSFANIKHHRLVRQLNAEADTETAVNYEETAATNSYHQPHFTGNRTVIVELFEWKFVDVAAECRDFLGPQGYAGVQLSPVLEHIVIKTEDLNHPWWERYEVVSYRFSSRSGDESEFWSMSRICNEHGVRIYADVVLNHMAAPLHFLVGHTETTDSSDFIVNTLLATNVNISQLNYSNVPYTPLDFHRPECLVMANAQDAHEIRNCQMNGHPDLDHTRSNVQKNIVKMLNGFVDMGVAGFRIDAAKHMWPIDLKNIFKQVKNLNTELNFKANSRPFLYHDVFDLGLDTVSKTEYSTYGVVSEYLYPAELATIFNGKVPLSSLINWGPALGFLTHDDSLVFIDSHDTQRGLPAQLGSNRMLTYKQRIKYIMANVFMLVHPYGAIKRIMSSYYFPKTNINQGPPVEQADAEEIRSPQFNDRNQCTKESGWVCEHRWRPLVNMLKVASYFKEPGHKEESIIYFQTSSPNQVAFCRGRKAFVAINNDEEIDFVKEVFACLEPGTYCDVVTGGKKEGKEECHGKMLVINESGYMKLELAVADNYDLEGDQEEEKEEESAKIESYGIIVIYVESKIMPKEKLPANQNEAEAATANENQPDDSATKGNENSNPSTGDDATEMKDNAEAVNNDDNDTEDGDQTKEGDAEDNANDEKAADKNIGGDNENLENTNESQEKSNVEQSEGSKAGDSLEKTEENELEEEKLPSTENDTEVDQKNLDNTEEKEDSNPEENAEEEKELNTVQGPDEKKDSKENKENQEAADGDTNPEEKAEEEKEAEGRDSKENEENQEAADAEPLENEQDNEEETTEEHKEFVETSEAEQQTKEDEAAKKDVVQVISAEAQDEIAENPTEDAKTVAEATDNNQSRNINEKAEEQIEKPSAETIENIKDATDVVTAKVQHIQTAGFVSKPKEGGNDG